MGKWSLTRKISTVGCIAAAISLSIFIILASDRTVESTEEASLPYASAALVSPKTYGSYGELMFAYVGKQNFLYNLDDESSPLVRQPVKELLYASDDSVLYTAACEQDAAHPGRESVIQELQIGEQENRLYTIAHVTIDPCWSSNDEVIYFVEDDALNQLCTFEPLTSTTEAAAAFDSNISCLRISSDGLLVTLTDGTERLYVPLSKQLTEPGIPTKGSIITVCEQYDLFLTPAGSFSYHWQGAGELVPISENVLIGISHQDNEIFYIQQTKDETALMSFTVSEEQHSTLHALDNTILPQLTADADYAFMLNEQGVVYRYDIQNGDLIPYYFIDIESIKAPMISVFDYRLMVYDLSREPDASFCFALPGDTALTPEEIEQNMERAADLKTNMADAQQFPEYRYLSMGSIGDDVSELQNRLCALGYLALEPTGIYGAETLHAVSAAQADLNIDETGYANRVFQSVFHSVDEAHQMKPISLGDSGASVGNVKSRLISLGYMAASSTDVCDGALLQAAERYCVQNALAFDQTISEEMQSSIFEKNAAPYEGWLELKEGDVGDACHALNARLKALGYTAFSPRPWIDGNTISALSLFSEINSTPFDQTVSASIQEAVFSDNAIPCPEDRKPEALSDASSSTSGQVITDKELKILRKWLTKSFAVNHTDRQAVKRLQVRLKHLGYLPGDAVSMVYDAQTADAVRKFQTDQEIAVDGVPTKRTLMAVFSIMNSTLSGDE